jgi:AcrR family transcriptional regulator
MSARSQTYHHGNLRAVLLEAGNLELEEAGIEGFTMRGCARRAGVSHSAPATFFPSITAFFTALASQSFVDLTKAMSKATKTVHDPLPRMIAVGLSYATFAIRHPEHFRLMWRNERLDPSDPQLIAASKAAFAFPVGCIAKLYEHPDPMSDPVLAARVVALWSMIHGATELTLSGQLDASGLGAPMTIIRTVLPPMINDHFGRTLE